MKTYTLGAVVGGIIGFFVGLGTLGVMNFPQFLSYLFLVPFYDKILLALPVSGADREGLGWLYFVFSTLVGVGYGLIVASLIKRVRK